MSARRAARIGVLVLALGACATPGRDAASVGSTSRPAPILAASAPAASPIDRGPLSLEQALERAELANPDLAAAAARLDAARSRVDAVRARLFPTVDLELAATSTNHPVHAFMGELSAREFSLAGDFNDPDRTEHASATLSVTQVLWDGGRRSSDREQTELELETERHARDALRQRLLLGVVSTYLAILEADAHLLRTEDSLSWASAELDAARVRQEEGAGLRSEVLSHEVRRAEAEEARFRARHARSVLVEELRSLLALPADAPLEVEDAARLPVLVLPEDDAFERASRLRPDLLAAASAVESASEALEGSRRRSNPRLVLFASGSLDDDDYALDGTTDAYVAGLSLGWPLYRGGEIRSGVAQAEARLREANARLEGLRSRVTRELHDCRLRLEDAGRRREVAARALAAAEEALALVTVEREEGAATVTRLLEAEAARTAARARHTQAVYDALRAIVELRTAVGLDPLGPPDRGPPDTGPPDTGGQAP